MDILWVGLAAAGGGIAAALAGWADRGGTFDWRRFMSSVIRALIAGGAFAVGYHFAGESVSIMDLVIAFVSGSGVDVLGNRIAGAIKS